MRTAQLLPDGWTEVPLLDVVEVLDHKRVPVNRKERDARVGDIPYYGATGQVGWIDDYLFDEELVLLGEDGVQFLNPAAQKAYIITGKSWVNNHAHVLRPLPDKVMARFLRHILNLADYGELANGTTRLKLTRGAMARIRVQLPSVEEQLELVDALDSALIEIDSAVADVEGAAVLSAELTAALLAESASAYPKVPLGEIIEDIRYGTSVKCAADAAGPPVIRIPNIRNGRIDKSDLKFATVPADDLGDCFVEDGDLLLVRTNGSRSLIGRVAVVSDAERFACASYLIRVRVDRARVDPTFAAIMLSSRKLRNEIESRAASSAGQYNLNIKSIKALQIPLPDPGGQEEIVAAWKERERIQAAGKAELREASALVPALRRSLVFDTLSGRLKSATRIPA